MTFGLILIFEFLRMPIVIVASQRRYVMMQELRTVCLARGYLTDRDPDVG